MANLAYVGLGTMGGRMAARLLSRGHSIAGYNRTRAKAQWLVDRGMRWADTPRAAAENADAVFVMVSDSAALEDVGPKVTHVGDQGLAVSMIHLLAQLSGVPA